MAREVTSAPDVTDKLPLSRKLLLPKSPRLSHDTVRHCVPTTWYATPVALVSASSGGALDAALVGDDGLPVTRDQTTWRIEGPPVTG